jgi:hypothetical protein
MARLSTESDFRYQSCRSRPARSSLNPAADRSAATTAEHPGGINIFGRGFGNYDQDIVLRLKI